MFRVKRNNKGIFAAGSVSTQQFPDSPEVIYDILVADPTFSGLLGEYTFVGGQKMPAIGVQSPGADMPGINSITGLECIIHDAADLRRMQFYGSVNVITTWRVFLICWEPSTGSTMNQAATRLMEIFGGSNAIETVAVADGLGAKVQTMCQIPSNMPILV